MDEEQMSLRCPGAILLGKSELLDYALCFKGNTGRAYATIEEKIGEKIPVVLWEINKDDEKSLDQYEDFPILYDKKNLRVILNERSVEAMVYIMDEDMTYQLPKLKYYKIIEKAYEKFGFNFEILEEAWRLAEAERKK